MKHLILIVFFLSAVGQGAAQVLPFRSYSIENGLSQAVVNDLLQDDDGYLWVATGYGLNRFDGIQFRNYYEEDSLASNKTHALFQDSKGVIWVGSEGGVNKIVKDSILAVPDLNPLSSSTVLDIFEDSQGNYWFATDGQGVWYYEHAEGEITQYITVHGLAGNRVRAIAEDDKGTIWFATREGLTSLKNGNLRTYTVADGLPDEKLRDMVVAEDGSLWIATRGGLSHFAGNRFTNYTEEDGLVNNRIQSISLDENGNVWIGTEEGASYYDGSSFSNYSVEEGLGNNIIHATLYDREHNIWFGTFGGGIDVFLGDHIQNFTVEEGLPNNVITSVVQDQGGNFWITTYGGGLSVFNGASFKTFNEQSGLVNNKAYHVTIDSKKRLLIGTRWGFSIYEDGDFYNFDETELPYRKIRTLFEAPQKDEIWLGTYGEGVLRYDGTGFTQFTEEDGLANNTVMGIEQSDDGALWFATYGGVSRYYEGVFSNYTIQDGLPNNGVLDILKDQQGRLWFATFDGIAIYEEGTIKPVVTAGDYFNEVCYFILQDDRGLFWVGSNKGVVRFNYDKYRSAETESERLAAVKLITQNQGLVANEMNAGAGYKDREGNLWFGSVGGLTRFDPRLEKTSTEPPAVHIENVKVSGEVLEYSKRMEIGSDNHNIEFDFIGISLTAPDQVVYEYRLRGSGERWQRTKQRVARYSTLLPGDYTFQVRARNSDGVWSRETATMNIRVLAPFWMQWWFMMAVALILMGIVFFIYHYYRIRKMVDIERMRVRIASDLHDDVGSSLTEIALQSDFLQTTDADEELKSSLRQIGKQSRKIVSSLDDIVWSIDARNDTLGDLTDRMQDYVNNVLPNTQVTYEFGGLNMDEKLSVPMKENLYLIFKEAVNNIAKHSDASEVEVMLKNRNNSFDLFIHDNGNGHQTERKTGHGLRNMKMRAERIKATVDFKNESGFTVHVHSKNK